MPANTADSLYRKKVYLEAAQAYEKDIAKSASSDKYYNLGNCHYRLKNYGECVLAYQRALWLNPDNKDAARNLAITQTHLTDHFNAPSEMFFITMVNDWRQGNSFQTWLKIALAIALLGILAFFGFRLFSGKFARKTSFGSVIVACLAFVACNVFAFMQWRDLGNCNKAVVMNNDAAVFSSPVAKGKPVRTLHEGTTVEITDTHGKEWVYVTLPDGTQNWMAVKNVQYVRK